MKRSVARVLQGIATAGFDDPLDDPVGLKALYHKSCFSINEAGGRLKLNNMGNQVLNAAWLLIM